MSRVLGISAFYHDSAAALVVDGRVVAAASEERFSRIKNDCQFPGRAAQFCLQAAKLDARDVDAVVYYEKPFLTFERILETTLSVAPRGYRSFAKAIPVWIHDKLFLKSKLKRYLSETLKDDFDSRLFFSQHHLSHAAAAYYPSPFEDAAVLTVDGVGEWQTLTIGHGQGSNLRQLKAMKFPDSWGLFYSAMTVFLGFKVNSGEYKMMGLAPYGNTKSESYRHFYKLITSEVLNIGDDGSVALNPHYFAFTTSNEMFHQQRWERLFGISRRQPESELSQLQADLALATQKALEEGLRRLGATAQRLTQSRNLAMAGGVALNCVANSALKTTGLFDNIWIQPASGDAGSALGAALAYVHLSEGQERAQPEGPLGDRMAGALLGPEFGPDEIELELQTQRFSYQTFEKFDELCKTTANLLHQNKVVGWFQGRMEFGPRALGSRSILANAKDPAMQAHLNQKIKGRETFRPFAPIVLADDVQDYFEWQGPSPYMLFTAKIKEGRRIETPADFDSRSLRQKLLFQRSDLPSITHIDYSARLQTIHSSLHPQLFQLLQAYKTLSGCSVLINTSFNVREEPIVCSPRDALRCFQNTGMDALVMGNFLLHK